MTNYNIVFTAEIFDYSGSSLELIELYWKYSDNDGPYNQIEMEFISDNIYSITYSGININQEVEYFIKATNSIGNSINHPISGWHNFIIDSLYGDINGDALINVQDVIFMINYILEDVFNESADLNYDNQLNVLDIIELINLILGE